MSGMAPEINWGWSALNEVAALKRSIAEAERRIAALEQALAAIELRKTADERVKGGPG
jgi:phage shock protein A